MKSKIILIFFSTLLSCSFQYTKEERTIKKILKTYGKEVKLSRKVYLIFFDSGCGACVKMTSEFIRQNIDSLDAEFIVSANSIKDINIRFSYQIRQKSNFIADDKFISKEIITLYPKVFFIKNNRIIGQVEVNYGNAKDVFDLILKTARINSQDSI